MALSEVYLVFPLVVTRYGHHRPCGQPHEKWLFVAVFVSAWVGTANIKINTNENSPQWGK
jgi:hypothetical protein